MPPHVKSVKNSDDIAIQDGVIIGAGISGIGMTCQLKRYFFWQHSTQIHHFGFYVKKNCMQNIFIQYAKLRIKLKLIPKRVKNINFRIKLIAPISGVATVKPVMPLWDKTPFISEMSVSYPHHLAQNLLEKSLTDRLNWAIDCQKLQLSKSQKQPENKTFPKHRHFNDIRQMTDLTLQSEVYFLGKRWVLANLLVEKGIKNCKVATLDLPSVLCHIYRQWLGVFIQERQDVWQNMVEKSAKSITPYRMKSRWGSCSTQAKTIRLSIWLAQFPQACGDYVLVHELCHLHHANHSAKFWACVEQAMPEYKTWHTMLKNGLVADLG